MKNLIAGAEWARLDFGLEEQPGRLMRAFGEKLREKLQGIVKSNRQRGDRAP